MIALYKLDNFISDTLKSSEFIDFCDETIEKELAHYVQVDKSYMSEKKNYLYISSFERFDNRESDVNQEINQEERYQSLIEFVIDLGEPTEKDGVTRHHEKEALERVVNVAILSISKDIKELSRGLKILSMRTTIVEGSGVDTITCRLSITLGTTNKTLGACR